MSGEWVFPKGPVRETSLSLGPVDTPDLVREQETGDWVFPVVVLGSVGGPSRDVSQ